MKRILGILILLLLSFPAFAQLKLSSLPDAGAYNTATDKLVLVRSGAATDFLYDYNPNSGGGASGIDPRNYGAVCDGVTWSPSTGRPVQNGSDNDTIGFQTAMPVAIAAGLPLTVPQGCWVSNLKPISGLAMAGSALGPNYGYDAGTNAKPFANPILFTIGVPTFGINLNGAETVSFTGFEINATSNSGAYGNTSCIGSSQGSGGFGGKVWIFNMSFKGCNWGVDPTGGNVYLVSENSDYGANNNGIGGTFSDFLSFGDTFASASVGINFTSNAGLARISNDRFEYLTQGVILGSGGSIELNFDNNQFDHFSTCAINVGGFSGDVEVTGGTIKAGGLAGSLTVTGAANNGSGLIRLHVNSAYSSIAGGANPTTPLTTGNKITVVGVGGTTEANGNWTLTVVDGTHIDLQGSTFTNAYTSGGYAGVWGMDSDICLNASSASHGLTMHNVVFSSATSLGSPAAPAYILDATTANNNYIELIGGILHPYPGAATAINYESYSIGVANWETFGVPSNFRVQAQGTPFFANDTTSGSINAQGGMGICTSTPNAQAALDMGSCTGSQSSLILPQDSTVNQPSSPVAGMFRYNTSTLNAELYSNSQWNEVTTGVSVTAATPNIVINPSPGTNAFTVGTSDLINAQGAATSYTILSSDMGKTVTHNATSAVAVILPAASTTGFGGGAAYTEINYGKSLVTITPTTSTINGATTLVLPTNTSAYIISDGTNYTAFVGTIVPVSTGIKFTTSGCSISSTTGGAQAGTFTLGTNSCTAVITINGATGTVAPNGWACAAWDQTAPTVLIGGNSTTSSTTASFTIPAGAGSTDVIAFQCMGY